MTLSAADKRVLGCGAVILALAAALFYLFVFGMTTSEAIGGDWTLKSTEFLAGSHRGSPSQLFHRVGHRNVLIDEYVSDVRYYGEDCVVYVTLRTTDKQYFGVCGDRNAVLLATESNEEWILQADGMQKLAWVSESGNHVMRPTTRITIREIKAEALKQPRRAM